MSYGHNNFKIEEPGRHKRRAQSGRNPNHFGLGSGFPRGTTLNLHFQMLINGHKIELMRRSVTSNMSVEPVSFASKVARDVDFGFAARCEAAKRIIAPITTFEAKPNRCLGDW